MNNNEAEALRWYRQARKDGRTAAKNGEAGDHEVSCFLYQQAAEKLMKAVLYLHGERQVLGHAVRGLVRRCAAYSADLGELESPATELDLFYIPTRYPNGVPEGAPFEYFSERHSAQASAAFDKILSRVEPLFEGIAPAE